MKVYYYHTIDIRNVYQQWRKGTFPGHFLYGATHLRNEGIDVVMHQPIRPKQRWKLSLHTAFKILTCHEHYDAIYATTFRGLEIIIFLRALGLFPHPVCVWHHQPVVKAKSFFREMIARLFYKGIDQMFFFSDKIIQDSLHSVKAKRERMHVVRWGADLKYYDALLNDFDKSSRSGFISTGKKMRDMPTLIGAFNHTSAPLDIYSCREYLGKNYERMFADMEVHENINIHFIGGLAHAEMSKLVNKSQCVVICCFPTNYTVGLTTVVEALALGIPLICTKNLQMPMDIEHEHCGITVEPGDVDGWEKAVNYIAENPDVASDMGRRGRELAEKVYNLDNCAKDVSAVLKTLIKK